MEFTLKNYQDIAVRQLVKQLSRAAGYYRDSRSTAEPERTSVSLAAVTGAGKTVMAAATVEDIFRGTTEVPADPTATFLWVSDSPELNTQSRFKIEKAYGASPLVRTREIGMDFREERLSPGTLYFINIQKLSRTSTIARSHYKDKDQYSIDMPVADAGDFNVWETIGRTLEDESCTLYLIIDEAHRGMKRRTSNEVSNRGTIVQRLINGDESIPPVPVVLGISATPGRFRDFMSANSKFGTLPEVTVDAEMVQDSGLLKDNIVLSIPNEPGNYDHALLAQGARRLKEMTAEWNKYTDEQGTAEPIEPLMVVQVPDKASDSLIDEYVDTVLNEYGSLSISNFAHVFGDDKAIKAGGSLIHRVPAERIQEAKRIRVLFAKEAISTGWDCPRAEVMVSFRAAKDATHITQLIGRMIRTPLARRIEGNDVLNSVTCILPKFDEKIAKSVAKTVAQGGSDWSDDEGNTGELRRVLIDPETVHPDNRTDAMRMWELFQKLPSEIVPTGQSNPIKRLNELVVALSADGILPMGIRDTRQKLFKAMQAALIQYDDIPEFIKDIENIEVKEFSATVGTGAIEDLSAFSVRSDNHAIMVAMKEAERIYGPDLARGFVEWQLDQSFASGSDANQFERILRESQVKAAALAKSEDAIKHVNDYADKLFQDISDACHARTKDLGDARQSIYREIWAQSSTPVRENMEQPANWSVPTFSAMENTAGERTERVPLPRWGEHLMISTKDQKFPSELNPWEEDVFRVEASRSGFIGWFRNAGSAATSLNIAYPKGRNSWGRLRPDFIFFREVDGEIKACIVDPHSAHLGDALPKLKGYVRFVEAYPDEYQRVESVSKVGEEYRMLDLLDEAVRRAINEAVDAPSLYESEVSRKYV